ncbi:MAG TPA: amino acid racemase [Chitinophaga sp.]
MKYKITSKKKLGIIGGMGSHAGVWLFNRITELSYAEKDQEYLDIIVHSNSDIPDRTRAIVYKETSPLPELQRSIRLFNSSNVEVAVLACMTAHYYCEQLERQFNGKILSAVELVLEELTGNPAYSGKKKIGLIGSTGLLKSRIYHNYLEPLGYEVITLNDTEQEEYFMRPIYMEGGIKSGVLTEEVKQLFCCQVPILAEKGAEVVVGACSEVPLVIRGGLMIPFIDAFELLAQKTVDYCYNQSYESVSTKNLYHALSV